MQKKQIPRPFTIDEQIANLQEMGLSFRDTILKEIDRNDKSPYIKNFKENYENGAVPFYAAVEVFTFGTLSKFYKNMKVEDKKQLSDMYPEVKSYNFLQSWLESISAVRNICAHYGRIYNVFLLIKPRLYEGDKTVRPLL